MFRQLFHQLIACVSSKKNSLKRRLQYANIEQRSVHWLPATI